MTPADFVRGRHGSRDAGAAIAITGIVATMPYIALQLVGIEAVLKTMGISGDWPIIIAFAILAAYTYQSGLRAPALIAFVKDALIYLVVIVAIIYIPSSSAAGATSSARPTRSSQAREPPQTASCSATQQPLGYSTLALGSALALFIYPHSVTACWPPAAAT